MSITLTFPGRPLENYRGFDIYPGQFDRDWQALHKDADDADDDRVMWAKSRAQVLSEVDLWHWEREVEPLLEALRFYADESAWNQPPVKTRAGLLGVEYENQASKVRWDRGRIARAAISRALPGGEGK